MLFRVMRNSNFNETLIVAGALDRIQAALPANWIVTLDQSSLTISGANSQRVSFALKATKSGLMPKESLLAILRDRKSQTHKNVLLVSDFIGPSLRAALAEQGISYADPTGWVRIVSEEPLIILATQGADRSPRQRTQSAIRRFNGVASGRTLRALTTAALPVGVRPLAKIAGVSPGSVSKILETLAAENIVERDSEGAVTDVRRQALIVRWAQDYSFVKSNNQVGYYIAPRGLDRLSADIKTLSGIAVTGSAAARSLLPESIASVVPLRLQSIYAPDPPKLASELGLIKADPTTANVIIAKPQDREILPINGLSLAPLPLVLADLLTLPGRGDSEATQLFEVLAQTDPHWRN